MAWPGASGGKRSGARLVTPRDFSQVPVEQLARLLLERARHDPGLPRRTPANSNEPPPGWQAPPVAQPCQPWFPERLADQPRFAGQDRLEELVTQAVTAAQQAEETAQATRAASRRANRGAAIAIALGILGVVAGISAGFGNLAFDKARPQQQASAEAVQPADVLAVQPASVQSVQPAAATASDVGNRSPAATQAEPDTGPSPGPATAPALAPATFVRVLPAVPASPPDSPDGYQPYAPPPASGPHPAPQHASPRMSLNHLYGSRSLRDG